MKVFENFTYFIIMCVMVCYCNVKNDTDKSDVFVPTNEWQVVKKGQAVPKGLHIRINFETGLTEAKLLEPRENQAKSLSVVPEEIKLDGDSKKNNATNSTDEEKTQKDKTGKKIEQKLKNIPGGQLGMKESKFRGMEMQWEDGDHNKITIRSDYEIMLELFQRYEDAKKNFPFTNNPVKEKLEQESVDSPTSVEILNIMVDFEYLVHQIDNGNDFVHMQGLEKIVYPHLNGSDYSLKAEAIKLLGSCLQNNLKAQVYALETNAGEHLLKILALDKNEHVKEKAVYALGCLVRRFPLAQKQIISKHGMDVFQNILMSDNPLYVKLKIKIIILLEDLVLEHKSVLENHVQGDPDDEEKLKQYYQVNLISKLSNPTSCVILSNLLQEHFEFDNTNVDNIDKIFSVINTFSHICKHHHYKDKKLLVLFHKMQTLYKKIIDSRGKKDADDSSEDTEYFQHILDMIQNYMNELNDAKLKDEL